MPDDPIFVALNDGRPLTLEVAVAAKTYRLDQINELWREIRILEARIRDHPGPHPALAERDPPVETAERSRH